MLLNAFLNNFVQMKIVLLYLFLLFDICNGYKILIYNPMFGFSHVNYGGRIADILSQAGHQVIVLQPLIDLHQKSNGSMLAEVIHSPVNQELQAKHRIEGGDVMKTMWVASPYDFVGGIIGPITHLAHMFGDACRDTIKNEEVMEHLKAQNFDLAITEMFDFSAFAVFHRINVTNIIGAHSMGLMEGTALAAGVPIIPSYMPASLGITSDSTDFISRVYNLFYTYLSYYFEVAQINTIQAIMDEHFGPSAPRIWDMMANITWFLTNAEPLFDFPRPTINSIVEIGDIIVREAKKLDEYWDDILSLRKRTVLVSFGSIAPSHLMPEYMKMNIMETFAKFPDVTFIWKYEKKDDSFKVAKNVILFEWLPQNDLLADSRLTCFITHGGAGSMRESSLYGKPVLAIPLFTDQRRNANIIVRNRMGILYDKRDLSDPNVFYKAVHSLLNDESLYQSANRIKDILSARPVSSKDKLLSTVDMACRFGHLPLLRPSGASLGYLSYYNIDILATILFIIFIIILVIVKVFSIVSAVIFKKKKKTE